MAGVLLVLPLVFTLLPGAWVADISPYLPSSAGMTVTDLTPSPDRLEPWTGLAVFADCAAR